MTEATSGASLSDGWAHCEGGFPEGVSGWQNEAVGPGPGRLGGAAWADGAWLVGLLGHKKGCRSFGGPHGELSKARLTDFETIEGL